MVTGGAGFIGSHLVDALLAGGCVRVAVVDNFFLGKDANLAEARALHGDRLVIYREDAADFGAMSEICRLHQPEFVFNLATKALLYSFFNPAGACRVNLDVALTLAELQRSGVFGRLIHLSSSEVYGSAATVPMDEGHPLLAETTYAAGKAAADLALAAYVRMFDLDVITVRPFNNYGPRQNDKALGGVVPVTIRRVLDAEPPTIEGDGAQTRDFIYVTDTVDAIMRIATSEASKGEVLNVGSGEETSIATIVNAIADQMGWAGPINSEPARRADVMRHCADVSKATALVGPIARTTLGDGLKRTIAWHQAERTL